MKATASDSGHPGDPKGSQERESIAFSWASHLVRALYTEGIRHIVISPGSRSTPLTLACAAHAGLQLTVALDERSAGFIALGIGKADPRPAALICTSGTAGANYTPSIWEARNSGTAMIVLTADRPPSLRGNGSSQTLDQIKLFGSAPVHFHECGEPRYDAASLERLAFAVRQGVSDARMLGGASHLNLPFDKPFEPDESQFEMERARNQRQIDAAGAGVDASPATGIAMSPGAADGLQRTVVRRPIIVAGPMNASDPLRNVLTPGEGRQSWTVLPVLADPGALPPTVESLDAASLQSDGGLGGAPAMKPDLIVRLGDTPFSGHLNDALTRWSDVPTLLITSRPTWQHPYGGSGRVDRWVTDSASDVNRWLMELRDADPEWLDAWRDLDYSTEARLAAALDEAFTRVPAASHADPSKRHMTDLEAIVRFWNRIPEDGLVMLSNSLIPRDVSLLKSRLPRRETWVNRGVAGIDGITSTAVGIALARSRPTWLLTGDLAFLHDANALLQHASLTIPVTIGVIDNGGGSIFRSLPIHSSHPDLFRRFFETPQSVDLGLLCQAHGIPYHRIQHPKDMDSVPPSMEAGFHVFDMKTDPDRSHLLRRAIHGRLRESS